MESLQRAAETSARACAPHNEWQTPVVAGRKHRGLVAPKFDEGGNQTGAGVAAGPLGAGWLKAVIIFWISSGDTSSTCVAIDQLLPAKSLTHARRSP